MPMNDRPTMKVTVKRETTFQFTQQLTLDDLRIVVEQCTGLPGQVRVDVTNSYGQRDQHEATTVTVHGA